MAVATTKPSLREGEADEANQGKRRGICVGLLRLTARNDAEEDEDDRTRA